MSAAAMGIPLRLRRLRLQARITRFLHRRAGSATTVYVQDRVDEYRDYWRSASLLLGASFTSLSETIWEVRLEGRRTRIAHYMAGPDDSATRRIAGDKLVCYALAAGAGVPVPVHRACRLDNLAVAHELLRNAGRPLVVKPLRDSASALGVTLNVRTPAQLDRAAALASLYGREILVEEMLPGESYRLLYLDGRLIHAVRRTGLRVRGDGHTSVEELVRAACGDAVEIGSGEIETLRLQRLTPADVPEPGQSVLVSGTPPDMPVREHRTIYTEDVTPLIGRALERELGRVVEAVGSRFAGVDIVAVDPGLPLRRSGGAFLEINTTPGIHHHYQNDDDRRRHPVAVAVLRSLLSAPGPEPTRETPRAAPALSWAGHHTPTPQRH